MRAVSRSVIDCLQGGRREEGGEKREEVGGERGAGHTGEVR